VRYLPEMNSFGPKLETARNQSCEQRFELTRNRYDNANRMLRPHWMPSVLPSKWMRRSEITGAALRACKSFSFPRIGRQVWMHSAAVFVFVHVPRLRQEET
jgi:hypothetical protein